MDFLNSMKEVITKRPSNLKKPLFYKEDSDAITQLELLKEFQKSAPTNIRQQIEQDIKMLSYGISGEQSVAFELNNSYLPIIVLHDLHIEFDGLAAQIDYLIITNKITLIVECKNLIGNIEVNSSGDFIRTIEYNGKFKKEGIYSPITQNVRHLEMIKKVRMSSKENFLTKALFEKHFNENYKSVVVLANPKTIINTKYAKAEVKKQIIRVDQLVSYIKKLIDESDSAIITEKQMYELADFYLSFHTSNTSSFISKYNHLENKNNEDTEKVNTLQERNANSNVSEYSRNESISEKTISASESTTNLEDLQIYKELKKYRYNKSISEGVKAYYIFNNAQMEDLILKMPKNIDELLKISGFGPEKCKKYGDEILKIINSCIV